MGLPGKNVKQDVLGKTFGKLTVVSYIGSNPRGRAQWLCQCSCGNTRVVFRDSLVKNVVKSCGCSRYPHLNLAGKRFGRLVAQSPVISRGEKIRWVCLCDCGNTRVVSTDNLMQGNNKSCGCTRSLRGDKHPCWNGGRFTDAQGYVHVFAPQHPNAKRNYVREHLLVMSSVLGRPIDTNCESVHHRNGLRNDNRAENLELRYKNHEFGQNVTDLVTYILKYHDTAYERMRSVQQTPTLEVLPC